jgi:GTP-binding protein EngB required for normal cell division
MGNDYISELKRKLDELIFAKKNKDNETIAKIRNEFPQYENLDVLIHSYTDRQEIDELIQAIRTELRN